MFSSNTAIIGAGMAGITAARALNAAGKPVQVFEKSRGSGGRLASKRSEMGRVNLGTQNFKAEDALFIAELERWQQAGWVKPVDRQAQRWAGHPYSSALTRHLLAEITTHFSCEIRRLSHTADGWLLLDHQAQTHGPFQQVIVAVPAPQAAHLLSDCAPALAAQATCVEMQPAWMVALGFKNAIELPAQLSALDKHVIADCIHTPQSTEHPMQTIMLRATVKWSTAHIEDTPEQVINALTQAFASALKQAHIETPLPAADHVFAHRWRYAEGALTNGHYLLTDSHRPLYVAGDWCGQGDVESAWQSGRLAAEAVLQSN